jgi:hypothetical protein
MIRIIITIAIIVIIIITTTIIIVTHTIQIKTTSNQQGEIFVTNST